MVRQSGGTVAKEYAVLDAYRRHKAFKPAGIAELNEGGIQLAHALADEIAAEIDLMKGSQSTDFADSSTQSAKSVDTTSGEANNA